MTIRDLLETQMINDETKISVDKPYHTYGAELRRNGSWPVYEGQIVDLMDEEIQELAYEKSVNEIAATLK
ncbi:MAG: hypothetical protein IJ106_10375 [Parasporobacterium sp.]|nr:hypothetical protein [Parasporobacterium sp.]